jgi:hypothetical protein
LALCEILFGVPVFLPTSEEEHITFRVLKWIRVDLPEWMWEDVKALIRRCWAEKPGDGPQFGAIIVALERIRFGILPGVDRRVVRRLCRRLGAR